MRRNQYIGLTVLALAVLLVIYKVRGQSFGSFNHDQPYLVAPVLGPSTNSFECSTNLIYHWIASDITYTGLVSSWTDRIQGVVFMQTNAANQPLKTNSGIWFDGSNDWLECTNSTSPKIWNFQVIGYIVSPEKNFGYINGDNSCTFVHGFDGSMHFVNTTTRDFSGQALAMSNICDLYLFGATASGPPLCFTNGVYTYNLAGSWISSSFRFIGVSDPNCVVPASRAWFKGYIYEIKVWTNCVANQPLATNYATYFHQYRTNTYTSPY